MHETRTMHHSPRNAASGKRRASAWRELVALPLCALPAAVFAQVSSADAGSTLWSAFRSVLYGPWGLVGSAIVVAIGIYMFLERGFMHALGVMAAGALIFFVPLIVISMRNTAQALGGGG
jgi:hypothetical protein